MKDSVIGSDVLGGSAPVLPSLPPQFAPEKQEEDFYCPADGSMLIRTPEHALHEMFSADSPSCQLCNKGNKDKPCGAELVSVPA